MMDDYLMFFLPDKLRLDQLYARNHRFFSDLDVIFLTLLVLLPQLHRNFDPAEILLQRPLLPLHEPLPFVALHG